MSIKDAIKIKTSFKVEKYSSGVCEEDINTGKVKPLEKIVCYQMDNEKGDVEHGFNK